MLGVYHEECEYFDDACYHGISLWDDNNLLQRILLFSISKG